MLAPIQKENETASSLAETTGCQQPVRENPPSSSSSSSSTSYLVVGDASPSPPLFVHPSTIGTQSVYESDPSTGIELLKEYPNWMFPVGETVWTLLDCDAGAFRFVEDTIRDLHKRSTLLGALWADFIAPTMMSIWKRVPGFSVKTQVSEDRKVLKFYGGFVRVRKFINRRRGVSDGYRVAENGMVNDEASEEVVNRLSFLPVILPNVLPNSMDGSETQMEEGTRISHENRTKKEEVTGIRTENPSNLSEEMAFEQEVSSYMFDRAALIELPIARVSSHRPHPAAVRFAMGVVQPFYVPFHNSNAFSKMGEQGPDTIPGFLELVFGPLNMEGSMGMENPVILHISKEVDILDGGRKKERIVFKAGLRRSDHSLDIKAKASLERIVEVV